LLVPCLLPLLFFLFMPLPPPPPTLFPYTTLFRSPEWIYFVSLYHIFHDKLCELDEQDIAPEGSGFKDSVIWNKLYQFHKDGVMGLIRKLEKYNGAILADSVGLGKTFSALAEIGRASCREGVCCMCYGGGVEFS